MNLGQLRYQLVSLFSWLSLFAERFWASFWPALSVLFAFIGLAALRVFPMLGNAGHIFALAVFSVLFVVALTRYGTKFHRPSMKEVRRAVEKQSGLLHRPLEAILDRPITTSPETAALWAKYQARLKGLWSRTKIHRPRADIAAHDKYSLRYIALAVLLAGLAIGQRETLFRITQALNPDIKGYLRMNAGALDVWITPPEYTNENPIFLATTQLGAAGVNGGVQVPQNSILKVRIGGLSSAPTLAYGDIEPAFTEAAPKSFTLEMPLTQSGMLKLTKWKFRTLGEWPITVLKDKPPAIVLLKAEPTKRDRLQLIYTAKDDYRIKEVYGSISPTQELIKVFGTKTVDFNIPLPETAQEEKTFVTDMTSHPWAGSEVVLVLNAKDDLGQTGQSAPQKILLPERQFTNPVAKQIIAERRKLIWYNNVLTRKISAQTFADIAAKPDGYKWDKIVFLGLGMTYKRLIYDGSEAAAESLVPLLWDLAIRVEDGGLALAQRELSDALAKLAEKLKDKNATKEEIADLMAEVQRKMREYSQNLAQEMRQRMLEGKQAPQISQELADRIMKNIDMDKLMKQMEELTSGSEAEQMQKLAEYMKNSVDRMDSKRMDKMQQGQKSAMEGLEELQKLIERQQQLIDKTQKLTPQTPEQKKAEEEKKAAEQKAQQEQKEQQEKQAAQQKKEQEEQQKKDAQDNKDQQGQQGQQQGQQQSQQQQGQSGQQQGHSGQQQQGQQSGQQQGQQQQQGQGGDSSLPSSRLGQNGQKKEDGQQSQGQQQGQQQAQGQSQSGQSQAGQPPQPVPVPQGYQAQKDKTVQQQGAGGTEKKDDAQQQAGQQGKEKPEQAQGMGEEKKDATEQGIAQGKDGKEPQQQPQMTNDNAGAPVRTPKEGATEQTGIRGKLGEIMRKIGEGLPQVPENFGKADQAMKSARNELKEGDPQGSLEHQKEALKELEGAMDNAVKQLAEQLQTTMMNFGMPQEGPGYGEGYDPLGRRMGKPGDNGQPGDDFVAIPEEKERRRVQQIIEELRARSNDYTRPKQEREYIDRLLNQFE